MDMEFPDPTIRGLGGVRVAPEVREEQARRWQALERVDLGRALQKLMGDDEAQFRGRQREVLEAIVARRSPIVAIMGTGVGKSLLFQLPAAMNPRGMTIVVVPLISLCDNMQDRCEQMGIRCAK
jgi:superfamily II DNA helicase RecQ